MTSTKKIAILGFDREGKASFEFFSNQNTQITICDKNPDVVVPDGAEARVGEHYLDNLDKFDIIVRTPGLPPQRIFEANPDSPGLADKITSGTNEFLRNCPTDNIIGVTGTKGKGTTSVLIARMLEAAGLTVHLGGNIGVPALSFLPNISKGDWVVLEMSSFQLDDLKTSPHIGVCLMVVPEHQDWHGSPEAYYTAKEQLFARQTPGDLAIYFHDNEVSERIASAGQGQKIPYYFPPGASVENDTIVIQGQEIAKTEEFKLLGKHNWQNACAAVTTVWSALQPSLDKTLTPAKVVEAMHRVLSMFTGLPFRIEFRGKKHDIRYYNDSFASAPPAPLAAIDAIPGFKVVIIGGFDRNLDLSELVEGLKSSNSIHKVLVIGAAAERIANEFQQHDFTNFVVSSSATMTEVVKEATSLAEPGDAVLLSPGFPSFDMFKDFEDRGRKFNEAVEAL